jgi:hypothetical protein
MELPILLRPAQRIGADRERYHTIRLTKRLDIASTYYDDASHPTPNAVQPPQVGKE